MQNGGSLEIYGKYFTAAKAIVGCDINEKCSQLRFDDPRIQVVIGDASSQEVKRTISKACTAFDIIIDDGSHKSSDIISSFMHYFPLLAPGGIYVVEDLCCSYWQKFEGGIITETSSIAFFKNLVDLVNFQHWGIDERPCALFSKKCPQFAGEVINDIQNRVYSIQFYNSMCVVTATSSGCINMLGPRIVVGQTASVVPGAQSGSGITSDERNNPSSFLK